MRRTLLRLTENVLRSLWGGEPREGLKTHLSVNELGFLKKEKRAVLSLTWDRCFCACLDLFWCMLKHRRLICRKYNYDLQKGDEELDEDKSEVWGYINLWNPCPRNPLRFFFALLPPNPSSQKRGCICNWFLTNNGHVSFDDWLSFFT